MAKNQVQLAKNQVHEAKFQVQLAKFQVQLAKNQVRLIIERKKNALKTTVLSAFFENVCTKAN